MITATVNFPKNKGAKSISASIRRQVEEVVDEQFKEVLFEIADYAPSISPVWSGAYVSSFSFVPTGSGAGRMRKPTGEDNRAMRGSLIAMAQANLRSDINSMDLSGLRGVVLRNRARHARGVEHGIAPAKRPYNVFARTADRFG